MYVRHIIRFLESWKCLQCWSTSPEKLPHFGIFFHSFFLLILWSYLLHMDCRLWNWTFFDWSVGRQILMFGTLWTEFEVRRPAFEERKKGIFHKLTGTCSSLVNISPLTTVRVLISRLVPIYYLTVPKYYNELKLELEPLMKKLLVCGVFRYVWNAQHSSSAQNQAIFTSSLIKKWNWFN
jgi:hypothetical protein